MTAAVEPAYRDHLEYHADDQRGGDRQNGAEHEAVGPRRKRGREISAEHIERAVRQIDQIHDAEDQRQAGRQEEQQHAELDAVQ